METKFQAGQRVRLAKITSSIQSARGLKIGMLGKVLEFSKKPYVEFDNWAGGCAGPFGDQRMSCWCVDESSLEDVTEQQVSKGAVAWQFHSITWPPTSWGPITKEEYDRWLVDPRVIKGGWIVRELFDGQAVTRVAKATNALLTALYENRSPTDEYAEAQNALNDLGVTL